MTHTRAELDELAKRVRAAGTRLTPEWDAQIELDRILGKPPNLRTISASELDGIPYDQVRVWCGLNAVYQLPTVELITALQEIIAGREAIEIGAGYGHIARALRITPTDSHAQASPLMREFCAMVDTPVVKYPPYVERLDARAAVNKYRPQVVIGCWITHRAMVGNLNGFVHGVDEEGIIGNRYVETYAMVGNLGTHAKKPSLRIKHCTLAPAGIVSRAKDPGGNRIWVWQKSRAPHKKKAPPNSRKTSPR